LNSLELYAKIEHLIGFYEDYDRLYEKYLSLLKEYKGKTVLEIGFGRGRFLKLLQERGFRAFGIEKSEKMVSIAKKKGLLVSKRDIGDIFEKFSVCVAIGDVLNYMDKIELKNFFENLGKKLEKNGIFIADINTYFGFSQITAGAMIEDRDDVFLAIDAEFEDKTLVTDIFLFEKREDCFYKESARILQYFYTPDEIEQISGFKIEKIEPFSLFSDKEPDKEILILKNV